MQNEDLDILLNEIYIEAVVGKITLDCYREYEEDEINLEFLDLIESRFDEIEKRILKLKE